MELSFIADNRILGYVTVSQRKTEFRGEQRKSIKPLRDQLLRGRSHVRFVSRAPTACKDGDPPLLEYVLRSDARKWTYQHGFAVLSRPSDETVDKCAAM
jgi:hypothetical protein